MTNNTQAPSLAARLSLIGGTGSVLLKEALQSSQSTQVVPADDDSTEAATVIQSHALVWFAISLAVPVEVGKRLMSNHLLTTHESLAEAGCPWTFEEFESHVGRSWMALVMAQKSSGTPMLGVCNAVFEGSTASRDRDITGCMELLPAITEIMSSTRTAVFAEYPAYDTESDSSGSPTPEPFVPDHTDEHYPLEAEFIAELSVEEARHHLHAMEDYPAAMTLVEYRRRERLRMALTGRVGPDLCAKSMENTVARPTSVPATSMTRDVPGATAASSRNPVAILSLVLGLLSVVSWFFVIIPILAMITGSAGLAKAKERGGKGKVMAVVGVGLGFLFAIVHVVFRIGIAVSAG